MPTGKPNTLEQFYAWIPPDDPDERVCTEWRGPRDKDGYGQFANKLGLSQYAHRAIYEIRHGKIPDGLFVLHHCDNPPCERDSHHWLGTHEDNMRDRTEKGRLRGEKNPRAILTEIEVLVIRDLANKDISNRSIADAFGIDCAVVRAIVSRRSWSYI
jgi:hypothetical protein